MRVPGRPVVPVVQVAPVDDLPCAGLSDMFESEDPTVINTALRVCGFCPAQEWCASQAQATRDAGLVLVGVWAGVSYGDYSVPAGEVVREAVGAVYVHGQ